MSLQRTPSTKFWKASSTIVMYNFTDNEALMQLVWKGFQEWLGSDHSDDLSKFNSTILTSHNIRSNACHESLTTAMINDPCIQILDLFFSLSGCYAPKFW